MSHLLLDRFVVLQILHEVGRMRAGRDGQHQLSYVVVLYCHCVNGSQHPYFREISASGWIASEEADRLEGDWFHEIPIGDPASQLIRHVRIGLFRKDMR